MALSGRLSAPEPSRSGRRAGPWRLGVAAAAGASAVMCALALAPSPAQAAQTATASQKAAMTRAVPAAAAFMGWRGPMRSCFGLVQATAKRSTIVPTYRFAYVRYRKRSTGPCSAVDLGHSFHMFWEVTGSGLRPRGGTARYTCGKWLKRVPVRVQLEMMPGCPTS